MSLDICNVATDVIMSVMTIVIMIHHSYIISYKKAHDVTVTLHERAGHERHI